MPIDSREKGKRGEREWRDFLRDVGFSQAKRGQQHRGGPDSPDVICEQFPVYWEVKRAQALALIQWVEQAQTEAPEDKWPAVAHRKNGQPWLVTMNATEFFSLLFEAADSKGVTNDAPSSTPETKAKTKTKTKTEA